MYDDILLPYDGSEGAGAIIHHASEIAHYHDATLRVLYVADTTRDSVTRIGGETVDVLVEHGQEVLEGAAETLQTLGTPYETDVVQGTPAQTIATYAEQYGYDLIVQPTHGRTGVSRFFLGSVSEKVLRLSTVPVLTARMHPDEALQFPYDRLLLPTDGSDASLRAVDHGLELAEALDAEVDVLSVVPDGLAVETDPLVVEEMGESIAEEAIQAVRERATRRSIPVLKSHVEVGDPASVIESFVADNPVDAVVMGTTGRRGTDRILLGSVAEKTVRRVPVPVLTVGGTQ